MAENSVIGALRVTLGLDSAQFEDGLKNAQDKLSGFGASIKHTGIGAALDEVFDRTRLKLFDDGIARVGLFGDAFEKLGAAGIAAGIGIGAAALALEGLNKQLDSIDKMGKMAQAAGVTVEQFSALKYAADLSDVSVEQLSTGMTRLSANMATVAEGSKGPASAAFQALGINVKNADGTLRDASDVMLDVAAKFSGMQDGATKTAIAVALFGRAGADLIPMLDKGATGIRGMMAEAQALGLVISEKTTAAAEDFVETTKRLKGSLDGIGIQIAAELAPGMETLAHAMEDAAKNGTALHTVGELLVGTLKTIASVAVVAGAALGEAWSTASGFAKIVYDLSPAGSIRNVPKDWSDMAHAQAGGFTGTASLLGSMWMGTASTPAPSESAPKGQAPALPDPNAAAKAAALQKASEDAIAKATKDELTARLALTKNINDVAKIKAEEVKSDLQKQVQDLAELVAAKKITASAGAIAVGLDERAAKEKLLLIEREKEFALAQHDLDQRTAVSGFLDRLAAAQEQLAGSAAQQNAIELSMLQRRQQLETDTLAEKLKEQVTAGEITQAEADTQQAAQAQAQAAETAAAQWKARVNLIKEAEGVEQAHLEVEVATLQAQATVSQSTYQRAVIGRQILDAQQKIALLQAQEAVDAAQDGSIEKQIAEEHLAALKDQQAAEREVADRETRLANAISETTGSITSMGDAFRRGDFVHAIDDLQQAIETVAAALKTGGNSFLDQIANFLGSTGSEMAAVYQGGSDIASVLAHAFGGNAQVAKTAGGILGGIPGFLIGLFTNHQPSNYTASATFGPGGGIAYGGDKPNQNTDQLIQQVAQAVLQGEQQLQQMGLTLNADVSSIAIGQRDPSKIQLSNGQTITSAAGDPAAAVDAALKGLLQSATFVDSAEKKLVDSMIAAGDGFDQITQAMQGYAQAQQISAGLADQILQLQDPQSYDVKQVKDAIQLQRDAAQKAADAGDLTADQLAKINAQLDTLQGLQIDQVVKKYADATTQATQQLQAQVTQKQSDIQSQIDQLTLTPEALLAKQRAAEMAATEALDSSLGPLLQHLYDLQDAATAAADAAAKAATITNLQIRLAQAEGDTATATQLQRQQELAAATDDASRAILRQIYAAEDAKTQADAVATAMQAVTSAQSKLQQAYDSQVQLLQSVITKYGDLAASLQDYENKLTSSADGGGSLIEQAAAAHDQFVSTAQAALGGDTTAAGNLTNAADTYLKLAQQIAATPAAYAKAVADVRGYVDQVKEKAQSQVEVAQQQLDALNKQVDGLVTINSSLLTIDQQIASGFKALGDALAAYQAASNAALTTMGVSGGKAPNGATFDSSGNTPADAQGNWYQKLPDGTVITHNLATANALFGNVPQGAAFDAMMAAASANLASAQRAAQALTAGHPVNPQDLWATQPGGLPPGLQARAAGGPTAPGLTLVGELGPELVDFREPGMVYSAAATRSMLATNDNALNENSVAQFGHAIDKLRGEMNAALMAIAANTANAYRLNRRWDGDGLPATRST